MRYKDVTIFEIDRRVKFLVEARENIVKYFNNLTHDFMDHVGENEEAVKLRQKINYDLRKITRYISATGTSTSIFYSPPPAIGGMQGNIDIFANIFNLDKFDISPQWVTDCLEKAIGIYHDERRSAIFRTFNPAWWIWKLVGKIINFPFFLIKEAGFDSARAENSIIGKLFKFILSVVVVFGGAVLPILAAFGYQERFVNFIKHMIRL